MKEIEQINKTKTEISVKKKKQVEHQYLQSIVPHNGHTIWEINVQTLEINKAKFSNTTYTIGAENKKEIIIKEGFQYVSALNRKNALKKYKQKTNGGKYIDPNPLKFFI